MQSCLNFSSLKFLNKKQKNYQKTFALSRFVINAVELINIPAILHNENAEAEAHKVSAFFVTLTIVYELTHSVNPPSFLLMGERGAGV